MRELSGDENLLDWVYRNEVTVTPKRRRTSEGWEVWWYCVRRGNYLCHPNGTPQAAIRDAMAGNPDLG